jgi:hypothetical protein
MVDTAAPVGGCHLGVLATLLRGQMDVLRGRHSWCWNPRDHAQISASPTPICFGFTSPLCEVLLRGIPRMVVAILANALPNVVDAGDVDALERRFRPCRRHCESATPPRPLAPGENSCPV